MKFGQQRPLASLLLPLLLVVAHLTAADEDGTVSRGSGEPASAAHPHHRNRASKQPMPMMLGHSRPRQIRGSWRAGNRWCRSRGRGGLAQISDASIDNLAARTRDLSPAGCYWVGVAAAASIDELRWLVDNPQQDDTGCLCVVADGDRSGRRSGSASTPRLHLARCSKRLPFLCQRPLPAPHRADPVKRQHPMKRHRPTAAAAATLPTPVELISDSEAVHDNEEMDSQEDRGKIPEFMEGRGILNPWPTTAAAVVKGKKPSAPSGKPLPAVTAAIPAGSGRSDDDNNQLVTPSQRSEFVTLLVLYSIVGVVCLVLVALCLVRCLRGCCGGRSRIRYVKQVDADDIPRFMPSSWA